MGCIISTTHYTPLSCFSQSPDLLSALCFSKWKSKNEDGFHPQPKTHFITLAVKISLCSHSHKLFPCRFRRRLLYLASEPKDRGRWGGGRGVVEDRRRRKKINREKEGMGKGGQIWGGMPDREDRKMPSVVSVRRMTVCAMCLSVLEGNNEQWTGQNNSSLPFRRSTNSNLNIQPPSPGANTAAFLWYLFYPLKSLMLLVFETPA